MGNGDGSNDGNPLKLLENHESEYGVARNIAELSLLLFSSPKCLFLIIE